MFGHFDGFFTKHLRATATLLIKETAAQVFNYEFCDILKNTFFIEHLQTTPGS